MLRVTSLTLAVLLCGPMLLAWPANIVNGQFFTKTSNSIPRMGRRADPRVSLNALTLGDGNIQRWPSAELIDYLARSFRAAAAASATKGFDSNNNDNNIDGELIDLDYDNGKYEQLYRWLAERRNAHKGVVHSSSPTGSGGVSAASVNGNSSGFNGGVGGIKSIVASPDSLSLRALYLALLRQQISSGQQHSLMAPQLASAAAMAAA